MRETAFRAFRTDINGLRAVAVAAVVCYHFGVPPFTGGFVGVDVFFVISGFLMASIARKEIAGGRFSIGGFLLKRLRRIFPALAVVTLACMIWAGWSYLPGDYQHLVRVATTALTFRSNFSFAGDVGYFQPDAQKSLFLHTWSLSVEAQFYLAFAIVAALAARFAPQKWNRYRWTIAALLLGSLAWCIFRTESDQKAAFYLLASRAWEFLSGAAVACLSGERRDVRHAFFPSVCGAVLLCAGIVCFDAHHAYPGWRAVLPVAGTALIILADGGPFAWVLNLRPLQFLGNISYSVYLWHWPLLLAYKERVGAAPDAVAIAGLIVASIVAGWLSYACVEQPTRKALTNRGLAMGAVATILAGFGYATVLSVTNGWPQRLPAYLLPAVAATANPNARADECTRKVDGTKSSPGDFCAIGTATGQAPTMILWGDSFAERLQPAVSDIASSLGMAGIVATEGGCPPFRGKVFAGSGAEVFSGCEKYANFAFDYFERNESITMAVVAGDWQRYETEYEGRVLKQIAEILARRGGYMVLVSMVPNPHADVPREWARRQFQAGGTLADWSVPIADEQALIDRGKRIAAIAGEAGNVIVVDPFKVLCDASGCASVKDRAVWYSDTDHLSGAGVGQLAAGLDDAMRRAAAQQRVAGSDRQREATGLPSGGQVLSKY